MKTNIVIYSDKLEKEDIRLLLQGIRDLEQKLFPQKEMGIFLFADELTTQEATAIMTNLKPPPKFEPLALGGKAKEDLNDERS